MGAGTYSARHTLQGSGMGGWGVMGWWQMGNENPPPPPLKLNTRGTLIIWNLGKFEYRHIYCFNKAQLCIESCIDGGHRSPNIT